LATVGAPIVCPGRAPARGLRQVGARRRRIPQYWWRSSTGLLCHEWMAAGSPTGGGLRRDHLSALLGEYAFRWNGRHARKRGWRLARWLLTYSISQTPPVACKGPFRFGEARPRSRWSRPQTFAKSCGLEVDNARRPWRQRATTRTSPCRRKLTAATMD